MKCEIRGLLHILKYFNELLNKQALVDAQLLTGESIVLTIEYLEDSIAGTINMLKKCEKADYKEVSRLLASIQFEMSMYLLDIERFKFLWFIAWDMYHKQNSVCSIPYRKIDNLPGDELMNNAMKNLLSELDRLNVLCEEKIISENELQALIGRADCFYITSKEIHNLIIKLNESNKSFIVQTKDDLIGIYCKLCDYLCELEDVRDILKRVLRGYSDKAETAK